MGADHLLWGTDLPGILKYFSYSQLMELVTNSGAFSEDELKLVMGENTVRVYRIKQT